MTIQQWLFSFKGRIGRRDFWIWMVTWVVAMLLLFFVAYNAWLSTQTAAFALVCLLWPTAAVVVKRLHDRGRSGAWAFLIILAWMLVAGTGRCCRPSSLGGGQAAAVGYLRDDDCRSGRVYRHPERKQIR
jgi:uncharacterized membrane protein YhaH (DUF805 family)